MSTTTGLFAAACSVLPAMVIGGMAALATGLVTANIVDSCGSGVPDEDGVTTGDTVGMAVSQVVGYAVTIGVVYKTYQAFSKD